MASHCRGFAARQCSSSSLSQTLRLRLPTASSVREAACAAAAPAAVQSLGFQSTEAERSLASQRLRQLAVVAAAAAAAAAASGSRDGRRLDTGAARCDGPSGPSHGARPSKVLGQAHATEQGRVTPRSRGSSVRCEALVRQGSDSSIITLSVEKDRAGLLAETTGLLKYYGLDIREAKISTEADSEKAQHIYSVQEKSTGKGLSVDKLEEVRKALEGLGSVECTARSWPSFTRAEVERHKTPEARIWVTFKGGVYDITEFVENHPGGKDKIMLAAGKSIEPFWRLYQQHEGRGMAVAQLEKMRIGDVVDPLPQPQAQLTDDPYDADPKDRHPGLIYHGTKPCNAEMPPELVMDNWLTPSTVWFIRHHHPVPVVDSSNFRVKIEGVGAKDVTLTLEDLRSRFQKREVISTIQCGGNRRSELDRITKTSGIPWGTGAISTAKWGGVYLREVLMHCAGVDLETVERGDVRHVVCYGMDDMQASIPIEKALSPFGDVLLAYEMNGEPLPPEHGSPLRLIAPGIVGVRNVKWVSRIELSKEEAHGPWQRGIAYKGFSPMQKSVNGVDVERILSMQEMPVQSAIMSPKSGQVVELDDVEVSGWAWSGGGRGIVRVDVSVDEGKSWTTAELKEGSQQNPSRAWAWTFWGCSVPIPECLRGKEITVLCRATDASYGTQPEQAAPIWNLRGLNCNCWHRVTVKHNSE